MERWHWLQGQLYAKSGENLKKLLDADRKRISLDLCNSRLIDTYPGGQFGLG